MNHHAASGRWGEDYTASYLVEQGYTILERNWHCRFGELDLIACREDILAIVEVKTRKVDSLVTPAEAVTASKRHKLLLSAECFLAEHPLSLQPRFDVAAITISEYPVIRLVDFEYYEAAFEED